MQSQNETLENRKSCSLGRLAHAYLMLLENHASENALEGAQSPILLCECES